MALRLERWKSAKRYVKKASQQLRPEINSFLGLP
jgi:hypothetical protein